MKKRVILAAVLGFFVPLFWGAIGFIYFTARESAWTDLFWKAVYVTCPFWLLPSGMVTTILTPFLNAFLYGFLAYVWIKLRAASKEGGAATNPGANRGS